jgi:endonuclease/exonuclease/phosphatase family metal-dependent hydrolase
MSESVYPAEQTVHLGTFNVSDIGEPLQLRARNAAAELVRLHFDVVGLQEVTPKHTDAIKAALPGHKRYSVDPYGHKRSGLMTLVDQDTFPDSESYRPNGRLAGGALLITELTRHDGQDLIFVNGHLPQEIYKEFSRIRQMMLLVSHLEEAYPDMPVVIVHDTNSTKAAPLNLLTQAAGYRSAHKALHGQEPKRTYPSKYGDELLSSRQDGKKYEVLASRALRRVGNALRAIHLLDDDGWDSPHAGCDVDRAWINDLIEVTEAGIFADDRQEGVGPISDHVGLRALVALTRLRQSAK